MGTLLLALVLASNLGNVLTCGEGQRYVLGQISEFATQTFMLDCKTGRVWQMKADTNDKGVTHYYLDPLLYLPKNETFDGPPGLDYTPESTP